MQTSPISPSPEPQPEQTLPDFTSIIEQHLSDLSQEGSPRMPCNVMFVDSRGEMTAKAFQAACHSMVPYHAQRSGFMLTGAGLPADREKEIGEEIEWLWSWQINRSWVSPYILNRENYDETKIAIALSMDAPQEAVMSASIISRHRIEVPFENFRLYGELLQDGFSEDLAFILAFHCCLTPDDDFVYSNVGCHRCMPTPALSKLQRFVKRDYTPTNQPMVGGGIYCTSKIWGDDRRYWWNQLPEKKNLLETITDPFKKTEVCTAAGHISKAEFLTRCHIVKEILT